MEFSLQSKNCAAISTDQSTTFIPEEIVTNILSRLQFKPLFRLKLVSKRWNSIISNPEFGQNYLQRALISSPKSSSLRHLCVMLSNLDKSGDSISNSINEEISFRISSSGLILCRYLTSTYMKFYLRVTNPLTKQSVLLPPLDAYTFLYAFQYAVGFATRGNPTNLTYKVVVIFLSESRRADSNDSTVMTFCSDKGNWTCKGPIACPKQLLSAAIASSCKGVLYWFHWSSRSIVTYDPYDTPDSFSVIQIPSGSDNILRNSSMNLIQLGQEDVLIYCDIECCSSNDRWLRVWRLVDYIKGEWYLEQNCPISPQVFEGLLCARRSPLAYLQPQDENSVPFLFGCLDKFTTIDLMSVEEALVGIEAVKATFPYSVILKRRSPYDTRELVPIAVCPWSSPFYGQSKANSS